MGKLISRPVAFAWLVGALLHRFGLAGWLLRLSTNFLLPWALSVLGRVRYAVRFMSMIGRGDLDIITCLYLILIVVKPTFGRSRGSFRASSIKSKTRISRPWQKNFRKGGVPTEIEKLSANRWDK